MQLVGKFLGEKMTRIYEKIKLHTENGTIHRTSAEIRAEITESDIPSEIARQTEVEAALAGKVDKEAGKELMPSPGEGLNREYFLNASEQWEKISPDAMVITMTVSEDKKHFLLDENELGAYLKAYYGIDSYEEERHPDTVCSHIGVYLKYAPYGVLYKEDGTVDNIYTIWNFIKVVMTSTEYGIPHLIARENIAEYDGLTIIEYYCQIDIWSRNGGPLKPHVMYSSITQCYVPSKSYVDNTKAGKADLQAHIDNASIHRTSAEIRAEITEADIPAAIARDAEVEAKILEHHESGEAHADLRNALANLESGAVETGSAEYARKLGTAADSYTKTQLDAKLNRHIRDVVYDTEHAKFTFIFEDGREIVVDTPLENTVTDGHYDSETLELVLVLVSGQEIRIPVSGLTKVYTGKDTATAATTINAAGEVSVALKTGGVDVVHLSAALLASINSHLTSTGDTKDNMVTFPDQSSRTNLASGDKHSVLFGKIKRWFSDLKALAFKDKAGKADLETALQAEIDGKVKIDGSSVMTGALYINNVPVNTLRARFAKNSYADAVVMSLNDAADVALCSLAANVNNAIYFNGKTSYNIWHAGNLLIATAEAVTPFELGNKIPRYSQSGYLSAKIFKDDWPTEDQNEIGQIAYRINGDGYHRWCSLTRLKTALGSMPANGGNADTVGGKRPDNLFVTSIAAINSTDLETSANRTSGTYRVVNPGSTDMLVVFQNPGSSTAALELLCSWDFSMFKVRTLIDGNRYSGWKQLAFKADIPDVSNVLRRAGDQTIDGNLTLNTTNASYVNLFRNGANKGYIGLGSTAFTDVIVQNATGNSSLKCADNGKCYANGKEIATVDQLGSGGDNYYPTVMNWTDGSGYGPRLNLSGIGMSALSATIPVAGVGVSGVVSTTAQTFAGKKSFNAGIDIIAGGLSVAGGAITCTGEISAVNGFYETSDRRLKKNVTQIHLSEKRIKLCEFDKSGRHSYGVIAQEIEKIYPTVVKEENGYKVVNYMEVLTIKCAEQDERIGVVEQENRELKDRLERLEKLMLK